MTTNLPLTPLAGTAPHVASAEHGVTTGGFSPDPSATYPKARSTSTQSGFGIISSEADWTV